MVRFTPYNLKQCQSFFPETYLRTSCSSHLCSPWEKLLVHFIHLFFYPFATIPH